jgi:hypothetical protein
MAMATATLEEQIAYIHGKRKALQEWYSFYDAIIGLSSSSPLLFAVQR